VGEIYKSGKNTMRMGQGQTIQDRSTKSSSRKKLLIIGGVALFVALWMFGLGVLVGRGTAPVHFDMEKLQNELAALKRAVQDEEKDRFRASPDKTKKGNELEFYEALKSTSNSSGRKLKLPPVKKVSPTIRSKKAPQGRLTVQIASLKDAPTADKMVAQLKAKGFPAYRAIGKIPGKGIWYRVRVGGFNEREKAKQMLARLNKLNYKGILVNQ
jgi:DedD protein